MLAYIAAPALHLSSLGSANRGRIALSPNQQLRGDHSGWWQSLETEISSLVAGERVFGGLEFERMRVVSDYDRI